MRTWQRLIVITPMLVGLAGCGMPEQKQPDLDAPLSWPYSSARRVAVLPVLNFTGENGFDPVRAADLLAAELGQASGVTVIPVSRVTAALLRRGGLYVQSPAQAVEICRAVGADAVLVPAITKYDPYAPMTVALTMEFYIAPQSEPNPVAPMTDADRPAAQIQHVFDASRSDVSHRIHAYARKHDRDIGPYGWKRYAYTQEGFLRFCFSEGLEIMFAPESNRMELGEVTDG